MCNYFRKLFGMFLKKLRMYLYYNSAPPFLDIYQRKINIQQTCQIDSQIYMPDTQKKDMVDYIYTLEGHCMMGLMHVICIEYMDGRMKRKNSKNKN